MYTYNLTFHDCDQNINIIYRKVDVYVNNHFDLAIKCVAIAVGELCVAQMMHESLIKGRYNSNS